MVDDHSFMRMPHQKERRTHRQENRRQMDRISENPNSVSFFKRTLPHLSQRDSFQSIMHRQQIDQLNESINPSQLLQYSGCACWKIREGALCNDNLQSHQT